MMIEILINAIQKDNLEEVKLLFLNSSFFLAENKELCFSIYSGIEEEKCSFSTAYLAAYGKTNILSFLQEKENDFFSQTKASDDNLDNNTAEKEITQSPQAPTNTPKALTADSEGNKESEKMLFPEVPTDDLESDKADVEMIIQPKKYDELNPLGKPAASPLHFVIHRIEIIDALIKDPDIAEQAIKVFLQKRREKLLNGANKLIITEENINTRNKDGKSALHLAAEYGIVQLVKQLLQREGQEITKDVILEELRDSARNITKNGEIKAKRQKKKFLKKTDINCQDHNGKTPLHYAVENGHKEVIELLHNAGAKTFPDKNGQTPPYPAAEKGYIEVLKLFLGEIDTRTLEERVKQFSEDFYKASDEREKDTLSRKEQKKIANHIDQYGQALLHLAAQNGHFEVVNFLVQKGASLEIKDNNCKTPFEYAIESLKALDKNKKEEIKKFINIINLLTDQPLQNTKDYFKKTDLHALAENGASKDELALLLKNKDIDINSKDILEQAALHVAILAGNTEMVRCLLEKGADPSQQDVFGDTPLHNAVLRGDLTSIKLLCTHRADSTIINLLGKKPIDLIVKYTEQNKDKKNEKPHLLLGLTGIVLIGIGFLLYYSIQVAQHNWHVTVALGFVGLLTGLLVSIAINKAVQEICLWHIESSIKKELVSCQEKSSELDKERFIPTQVEQPSKDNETLNANSR